MTAQADTKQPLKAGAKIDYQHRKVNVLETSTAGVFQLRVDKPSMLDQYRDHLSKNENVRSAMYEAGRRYMLLFEDTGLRPRAGSRMEFTDFQFGARGLENFSEKQLDAMDDFQKAQRQLTQKQRNECYDVLLLDAKVVHFKALRDGLIRLAKHWGYLNPRGDWDV